MNILTDTDGITWLYYYDEELEKQMKAVFDEAVFLELAKQELREIAKGILLLGWAFWEAREFVLTPIWEAFKEKEELKNHE